MRAAKALIPWKRRNTGENEYILYAADQYGCFFIWIFWCIVTAIYLGFSFLTWNWTKSWIIFPIALTLTPVVYYIDKKNKLK